MLKFLLGFYFRSQMKKLSSPLDKESALTYSLGFYGRPITEEELVEQMTSEGYTKEDFELVKYWLKRGAR